MNAEQLAANIESVKVMQLRPQDAVVFTICAPIPEADCASIKLYLEKQLPGMKILVLSNDVSVDVLRQEAA